MSYRTVVRTPPTAFPFASSLKTTGETWVVAKRWAEGGGVPFTTHLLSQWTAASSAQCVPPVLMGSVQLTHPRKCASGLHGSQVLYCTLTVPGVVGTNGEAVIVVIRGARDLPEPEPRAVGQSGSRCRRRFRLELEDRNAEVTVDRRRRRGWIIGLRCLGEWSAGAKLAVHEEVLVHVRNYSRFLTTLARRDGMTESANYGISSQCSGHRFELEPMHLQTRSGRSPMGLRQAIGVRRGE